jgi:hypothetical protein
MKQMGYDHGRGDSPQKTQKRTQKAQNGYFVFLVFPFVSFVVALLARGTL